MGRIIEGQKQHRSIETGPREYHAMTRGWIANEVFRRVDLAGRTIGEYLAEEISGPLQADVVVGLNGDNCTGQRHYTPGHLAPPGASFRPKFLDAGCSTTFCK